MCYREMPLTQRINESVWRGLWAWFWILVSFREDCSSSWHPKEIWSSSRTRIFCLLSVNRHMPWYRILVIPWYIMWVPSVGPFRTRLSPQPQCMPRSYNCVERSIVSPCFHQLFASPSLAAVSCRVPRLRCLIRTKSRSVYDDPFWNFHRDLFATKCQRPCRGRAQSSPQIECDWGLRQN